MKKNLEKVRKFEEELKLLLKKHHAEIRCEPCEGGAFCHDFMFIGVNLDNDGFEQLSIPGLDIDEHSEFEKV